MRRSDEDERSSGLAGRGSRVAGPGYRLLLAGTRSIGRFILRLRLECVGSDVLPRREDGQPAGGWIAAGLPHRTWIDPFVVAALLPTEPRLVFIGDARAIFRSALRRFVVRGVGGVIPIWPGGRRATLEQLIRGAEQALAAGQVLCIFPETGPAVPVEQARPLGLGVALVAIRSEAPIVPLILGGTHELYLGRHIRLVVLPPVTARGLGGLPAEMPLPEPWSPDELRLAHRVVDALATLTAPVVADAHRATEPPPGTRKRFIGLTGAFH